MAVRCPPFVCAAPVSHGAARTGFCARRKRIPGVQATARAPVPPRCARVGSVLASVALFLARAWGAGGRSRVPMPRARVFSFCPAYPRRQGGAGYPCPRLAAGRILAPRSALSPWPLAGRFRAVRGARRGLGRLAPAWLVRGGVRWLLFLRWCCGCVRRRCGGWRWRGPRGGGRRAVGRARFAVLRGAVRWCRRVARCSPRRPARAGRMTGRGGECGRAVLRGRPAFLAALRGGRAGAQATTGHLAGAEPVPSLAVAPLPAALRRHGSASGTRQAVGPGERPTRRAPALLPVAGFEWAVKRGRSWRWGRRPGADRHPRPIPGVGARTRIGAGYASAKDG